MAAQAVVALVLRDQMGDQLVPDQEVPDYLHQYQVQQHIMLAEVVVVYTLADRVVLEVMAVVVQVEPDF